jgi:hypothetical protein
MRCMDRTELESMLADGLSLAEIGAEVEAGIAEVMRPDAPAVQCGDPTE